MAQNVEGNINITSDTSQAIVSMKSLLKEVAKFEEEVKKINNLSLKTNINDDDIKNLDNYIIKISEEHKKINSMTQSMLNSGQISVEEYNTRINALDKRYTDTFSKSENIRDIYEVQKEYNDALTDSINKISELKKLFEEASNIDPLDTNTKLDGLKEILDNIERAYSEASKAIDDLYNKDIIDLNKKNELMSSIDSQTFLQQLDILRKSDISKNRDIPLQFGEDIEYVQQDPEELKRQAAELEATSKAVQEQITAILKAQETTFEDELNKLKQEIEQKAKEEIERIPVEYVQQDPEELKRQAAELEATSKAVQEQVDAIQRANEEEKILQQERIQRAEQEKLLAEQEKARLEEIKEARKQAIINLLSDGEEEKEFYDQLFDTLEKYEEKEWTIDDAVDSFINNLENGRRTELQNTVPSTQSDVNVSGISDILTKLLGLDNSKLLSGMLGKLGLLGGVAGVAAKGIKILMDQVNEFNNAVKNIAISIGKGAIDSIKWFGDAIENLSDIISDGISKLQELADVGIEVQNSYTGLANSIGGDAVNNLSDYADSIESIVGIDATGIISDINKLSGALNHLGGTEDQLAGAGSALYEMALNIHGMAPGLISTTKAAEQLNKAILRGKINKKDSYGLYAILGEEGANQFNKLNNEAERFNFLMEKSNSIKGAYNAYLNTEAGRIELLNQQYQSFQGNIGQIGLKLYSLLAPVLTVLLKIGNSVLNTIMDLFNIDVKDTSGISAIGDMSDEFEEVAESASKANKQVASFDDVIQINDSKSSTDALGSISELSGYDSILSGLIDDANDLTDAWTAFNEALAAGDYKAAGSEFMKAIGGILEDINWEDIKSKFGKIGDMIGQLIAGIFNVDDADVKKAWENIGKTIAESINSLSSFIKSIFSKINFVDVGEALGTAWKSFWENIDIDDIASNLYSAIMSVFHTVLGWLTSGGGLQKASEKLSNLIKGFFSKFTELDIKEIVYDLSALVDDIIKSFYNIAQALTSPEVKNVVLTLIRKLVQSFKDNASTWGKLIGDAVRDILDFIIEMIDTADESGLITAIDQFLDSLDLGSIFTKWLQIKSKIVWTKLHIKVRVLFQELGNLIVSMLGGLLNWVWEGGVAIVEAIGLLISGAFDWVKQGFLNIVDEIKRDIGVVWDKIKQFFTDIADKLKELWDNLNPANWGKRIGEAFAGIAAPAGSWFSGFEFKVPFMATGGIVTGSTIANIGEAGTEAVLPLESNTGWMDRLAEKLASKINKGEGTNGGSVTLDMSGYTKNFYTRAEMYEFGAMIVEALRVYGVNISLAV